VVGDQLQKHELHTTQSVCIADAVGKNLIGEGGGPGQRFADRRFNGLVIHKSFLWCCAGGFFVRLSA